MADLNSDAPRVLVVTSNNFNLVTGGGITLTNLFKDWPASNIANVHEDSTPEDESVCRNFYRLSDEIRWNWPLRLIQPVSNGSSALTPAVPAQTPAVAISQFVFGDGIPRHVKLTNRFREWLRAFHPELIYSFLGSMAQIRLAQALVDELHVPLAIHVMDDWPSVIYTRGLFSPFLRRVVLREFRALLDVASARLAICDEMCREYETRYGYPFRAFHNAIDTQAWFARATPHRNERKPFVIRYAGSILAEGQREALLDVCTAVSRLRLDGAEVEIWVHSPGSQADYLKERGIDGLRLGGPPDPNAIIELLASADLLVLPFNFDDHSARYLRLSMPTKIPAYMASGTPVLVYGPKNIAPVQYALHDRWGYVVTDKSQLASSLLNLMNDASARERLGTRAQTLAAAKHDASQVRTAFQSVLRNAVR